MEGREKVARIGQAIERAFEFSKVLGNPRRKCQSCLSVSMKVR